MLNSRAETRLVVLDDDPTGCQTVHNIKILLDANERRIRHFLHEEECFYILTNSRAYPAAEARLITLGVAEMLRDTPEIKVVSRSDSTLRGHFYEEVSALEEVLGPFDGLLIVPYFAEGGRVTLNDVHYVRQGDMLVPAHRTEFARDRIFGYQNAHLGKWVEEKSEGRWRATDIMSLSLEDIRVGGEDLIYEKLLSAEHMQPIVVNALADEDLEIVVLGLCRAEAQGKRFLYRTAASFVKVRAGIQEIPRFRPGPRGRKGLIVVGSYVQKSSDQLAHLLAHAPVAAVELNIEKILADGTGSYLAEMRNRVEKVLRAEQPVVLFTERIYARADYPEQQLAAGKKVSDFLSALVSSLTVKPDFVIAKGGITSHEVARRGLLVEVATVRGQISPGVPYWTLEDGKYPGLPYVVFPGNVGEADTLLEVFSELYKSD